MDKPIPPEIEQQIVYSTLVRDEQSPFPVPVGTKPVTKPCEDCGKTVTNRREEVRLVQTPQPHWRKHCKNCNHTYNPVTKKYDLKNKDNQRFFRNYLNTR